MDLTAVEGLADLVAAETEAQRRQALLQLKGLDAALQKRKAIDAHYRKRLARVKGIHCLSDAGEKVVNYAYFPIMVRSEYPLSRDALYQKLRDHEIYVRRYFYPLISDFPMYQDLPSAKPPNLPTARAAANSVLCLPMSSNLSVDDAERVVGCISNGAVDA
jgi:dTDP-4-amino-4,6-dideoxygalactose transaminase